MIAKPFPAISTPLRPPSAKQPEAQPFSHPVVSCVINPVGVASVVSATAFARHHIIRTQTAGMLVVRFAAKPPTAETDAAAEYHQPLHGHELTLIDTINPRINPTTPITIPVSPAQIAGKPSKNPALPRMNIMGKPNKLATIGGINTTLKKSMLPPLMRCVVHCPIPSTRRFMVSAISRCSSSIASLSTA
jgi:hypothetical protein